jgi:hypothetical protein
MPPKNQDARLDRDAARPDDRGGEDRAFSARDWERENAPTDPARRRAFRERWAQSHLPNLPRKPGWHRCWVSTNHPLDTVARRIAVGYRVIQLEELKTEGWAPEQSSVKDGGAPDNTVRWREMIGMECSEDDYQAYMREFHHDQPIDMERDIWAPVLAEKERIHDAGGRVEFGEGIRDMLKHRRADRQFE